jgi:hypothetical protein
MVDRRVNPRQQERENALDPAGGPGGFLVGEGIKTNLPFFTRDRSTDTVWFSGHRYVDTPSGISSVSVRHLCRPVCAKAD